MLKYLTITLLACSTAWSQQKLIPYYPGWLNSGHMKVADIHYEEVDELVHFGLYITNTSWPYFDSTGWDYTGGFPYTPTDLTYAAKQHGVPVFLSMANVAAYGGDGTVMSTIVADSARCQRFVDCMVAYMMRKGYSGGEINWEWPTSADRVGYSRMMRMFRRAFDQWPVRGILAHTLYVRSGNGTGDYGAYEIKSVDASADYHFPEMYTLQSQQTNRRLGYTCALDNANCNDGDSWDAPGGYYDAGSIKDATHNTDQGWNMGPAGLVKQGWSRHKIVVGLGFGYYHVSSTQPLLVGGTNVGTIQNYYEFNYADVIGPKWGHIPKRWDDEAGVQFMNWFENGTYNHVTYEEEMSLTIKAQSIIDSGYGGIMVYELGAGKVKYPGYVGPEQPLLHALYVALKDTAILPPPIDTTTPPPEPEPCVPETVKIVKHDTLYLPRVCPECPQDSVIVPPTPQPGKVVYTNDRLTSPWIFSGWPSTPAPVYNSTEQSVSGTSIKDNLAAWEAFGARHGNWGQEVPINPADYSSLKFSMRATKAGSYRVAVRSATNQSTYIDITVTSANMWASYNFPMVFVTFGPFVDFYIQNNSSVATTIYLDNISLVK